MELANKFAKSNALSEEGKENYNMALMQWVPTSVQDSYSRPASGRASPPASAKLTRFNAIVEEIPEAEAEASTAGAPVTEPAAAAAAAAAATIVEASAAGEVGNEAAAEVVPAAEETAAEVAPTEGDDAAAANDATVPAGSAVAVAEGTEGDADAEAEAWIKESEGVPATQDQAELAEREGSITVSKGMTLRGTGFAKKEDAGHNIANMDAGRFQYFCSELLGPNPSEGLWLSYRLHFSDGFHTEREAIEMEYRARVRLEERSHELNLIMERIDVDCSGFIEDDEFAPMLAHWKDIHEDEAAKQALAILEEAGPEDDTGLLR